VSPYASKGYKFPQEWSDVIFQVLGEAVSPGLKLLDQTNTHCRAISVC